MTNIGGGPGQRAVQPEAEALLRAGPREGSTSAPRLTQVPLRDSPAAFFNLGPGDTLLTLDGYPIRDAGELENHFADTPIVFRDVRTSQLREMRVVIPWPGEVKMSGFTLGVTVEPGTVRHRPPGPGANGPATMTSLGLRVIEVTPGAGAAAGLRPGDTILSAGPRPTRDPAALLRSVAESTRILPMTVVGADGRVRNVVVDFKRMPVGPPPPPQGRPPAPDPAPKSPEPPH